MAEPASRFFKREVGATFNKEKTRRKTTKSRRAERLTILRGRLVDALDLSTYVERQVQNPVLATGLKNKILPCKHAEVAEPASRFLRGRLVDALNLSTYIERQVQNPVLATGLKNKILPCKHAEVAELVDALDSKPSIEGCQNPVLATGLKNKILPCKYAEVAELVDALDSKSSSGNRVRVRFPPSVLQKLNTLLVLGFFCLTQKYLPNEVLCLCP